MKKIVAVLLLVHGLIYSYLAPLLLGNEKVDTGLIAIGLVAFASLVSAAYLFKDWDGSNKKLDDK